MWRKSKSEARIASGYIEIKSKFDAEFRRFSLNPKTHPSFEEFSEMVKDVHHLHNIPITITYTDPEGDMLPINNNDNFAWAISTAKPLLRLNIQHKGQFEVNGYGTVQRKRNVISMFIPGDSKPRPHVSIGLPEDFRQVSAIIDVDILPETQRRVKLMRNGSDRPLGFYIRDGTSIRVTPDGLEKVAGIFISRLAPGGLAESTGLLAVDDEVLEVNGIEVAGKTLDQVTDMMVANSANLIITIKPVNQHMNSLRQNAGATLTSLNQSAASSSSAATAADLALDEDEDEIEEFVTPPPPEGEAPVPVMKEAEDQRRESSDTNSASELSAKNSSRML